MSYTHINEAEIFAGFDRLAAHKEAKQIFEAAGDGGIALADFAEAQLRSSAMSLVLSWLEMGEYSYRAFEGGAAAMADLDENEELDEAENEHLNALLQAGAEALAAIGADPANVTTFIDDEDDEAGAALGEFLSSKMENVTQDDETIIATYAVGGSVILESAGRNIFEATVKRVIGGQLVIKKKRIGRPAKMSALQKAGLKKARGKAWTGAAKVARKKSMAIRHKRGL